MNGQPLNEVTWLPPLHKIITPLLVRGWCLWINFAHFLVILHTFIDVRKTFIDFLLRKFWVEFLLRNLGDEEILHIVFEFVDQGVNIHDSIMSDNGLGGVRQGEKISWEQKIYILFN